jgi:TPR repeat protein
MDDLSLGIRAFQKGQYEDAFNRLLPLAKAGEVRAQVAISRMYYAGNGVEKSHEEYIYWLQRAADGGDKSSKSQLKRASNALAGADEAAPAGLLRSGWRSLRSRFRSKT